MTKSNGTSLTYDPTLYAHWTKGTATYRVAYYAQVPTGEVGGEKHYEYLKSIEGTFSVETNKTVTLSDVKTAIGKTTDAAILADAFPIVDSSLGTKDKGYRDQKGFEVGNCPDVTVKGDGSTVFHINLDRKAITM